MPAESPAVWNLVKTKLAGWWVGATEGSTMQNTTVAAMCQKIEMRFITPIQWMGSWGREGREGRGAKDGGRVRGEGGEGGDVPKDVDAVHHAEPVGGQLGVKGKGGEGGKGRGEGERRGGREGSCASVNCVGDQGVATINPICRAWNWSHGAVVVGV